MKISVSSYSFGSYMDKDKLGAFGVIDKTKELGIEGVEFVDGDWTEGLNLELAARLKNHAEEQGIEIIAFCTGADFINGSGGDLDAEVGRLKKCIDFAKALGAKNVRHDVLYETKRGAKVGISYDAMLERLALGCRKVTEYAETLGIGTMTENHGFISQDSDRVEKLINATDNPNFGALIDVGNFVCADEDPCRAVGVLAPYVKHVHAKDFHIKSGMEPDPGTGWFISRGGNYLRGAIIGHGDAKVYQSLNILKRKGYDGYVTIEFEGIEDNLLGIRIGRDNLKRFLGI